jgi:hypothetical protein
MCETGILPEQIGAALEKFRPWTEIGTIATPAETRVQPRLPVRLERCRRFQPAKRVERALGLGASRLYPKSEAKTVTGADTRPS